MLLSLAACLESVVLTIRLSERKFLVHCCSGVSGYPRVLHGGFSAALLDETLGLLFYSLRQRGKLPFIGPAFTAYLEVDYKKVAEATQFLKVCINSHSSFVAVSTRRKCLTARDCRRLDVSIAA